MRGKDVKKERIEPTLSGLDLKPIKKEQAEPQETPLNADDKMDQLEPLPLTADRSDQIYTAEKGMSWWWVVAMTLLNFLLNLFGHSNGLEIRYLDRLPTAVAAEPEYFLIGVVGGALIMTLFNYILAAVIMIPTLLFKFGRTARSVKFILFWVLLLQSVLAYYVNSNTIS